jgi:hypothetical protein
LAVCHLNLNLNREEKTTPSGKPQIKVVFPKFKNGEATVQSIKVAPKFGMGFKARLTII